jgi:hypothetical protein
VSIVGWNDEGRPRRALAVLGLFGIGFFLFCLFGGFRLIASAWVSGREPELVWWPLFGLASMASLGSAMLGGCLLVLLFQRFKASASLVIGVLAAVIAVCLVCVGWDSLHRVEVRPGQIVVHDPKGAGGAYGPTDFAALEVGCLRGGRNKAEPIMRLVFDDGAEVDLADMSAIGWNGPPRMRWLEAAESIGDAARRIGGWRFARGVDGQPLFDPGCLSDFAARFPAEDQVRVVRLFATWTGPTEIS